MIENNSKRRGGGPSAHVPAPKPSGGYPVRTTPKGGPRWQRIVNVIVFLLIIALCVILFVHLRVLKKDESLLKNSSRAATKPEAAEFCIAHGYMNNYRDGEFHPDDSMHMKEVAAVLYNVAGAKEAIVEGEWYATQQAWAENNGIVSKFDPDKTVDWEDFVDMLVKTIALDGTKTKVTRRMKKELASIDGSSTISLKCFNSVAWALKAGILGKDKPGSVNSIRTMTRGVAAQMLMNYFKK